MSALLRPPVRFRRMNPFSHVSEQLIEQYAESLPEGLPRNKLHEEITLNIINRDQTLRRLLPDPMREQVIQILDTHRFPKRTLQRDIVSGPLDADKLDYLLRDSYHAGVKYGVFDVDRVISSLTVIDAGRGEKHVGVREDGVWALEQMLFARYHMTTQVYRHKVRSITDAMLVEGVRNSINEGCARARELYAYDANEIDRYLAVFLLSDDQYLVDLISHSGPSGGGQELIRRLVQRKLLKQIFETDIGELFTGDAVRSGHLARDLANAQARDLLRGEIAQCVDVPKEILIVDYKSQENPTYRPPGPSITEKDILVKARSGQRKLLHQVSQLFQSYGEDKRQFLAVYCPIDEEERNKREARKKERRMQIRNLLAAQYQ